MFNCTFFEKVFCLLSDSAMASTGENLNDAVLASCSGVDAQKRYFWLYNVQAKGPKGRQTSTLQLPDTSGFIDPHVLHSLDDPTHSDVSARGRRTRGSDIDANPRRLLQIGAEIHRLSSVVNQSPAAAEASLSPREKNKYASRICRLKRKAQHEANKIKLQGLDKEHRECERFTSI
jgi:CREB3 regulatory factor